MAVTPSLAQGLGAGGLFGATRSDTADPNRLNFTLALSEAFDSEVPPQFRATLPENGAHTGGYSTMLFGSAEYAHTRRRAQIAGTMHTAFRHDQRLDRVHAVSHSAGLGANIRLPGTAQLEVDQSAAYSPSYLFQLFPSSATPGLGEAIATGPDYRTMETDSYSYRSGVTLGVGTARGMHVSATGSYDRTDFANDPAARPTLATYSAGGKIAHGFRRNIGVSIDYGYRTGTFQASGGSTEQRVGISAQYSRALSASRRANFRVHLAPSILEAPPPASMGNSVERVYRTQGGASVDYQFGRTWQASANARRSVEYVPVLSEPILSDSGRVAVQGLFGRRVDLSAFAGYARGASAASRDSQLDSYTGNAKLRFALTRSLAVYSEYLYYYVDLRGYERHMPDLPSVFDQQGIRVGLTLWASAF